MKKRAGIHPASILLETQLPTSSNTKQKQQKKHYGNMPKYGLRAKTLQKKLLNGQDLYSVSCGKSVGVNGKIYDH